MCIIIWLSLTYLSMNRISLMLKQEQDSLLTLLLSLWLRAHNVRHKISIRVDNGEEFCLGSERKLREWNSILSMFDVELKPIPKGAKVSSYIFFPCYSYGRSSFTIMVYLQRIYLYFFKVVPMSRPSAILNFYFKII